MWAPLQPQFRNWPVVYTLDGDGKIYVGESLNVAGRFRQHLDSADKRTLRSARVVVDETFNKSVCLDLESYLIRLFAGTGSSTCSTATTGSPTLTTTVGSSIGAPLKRSSKSCAAGVPLLGPSRKLRTPTSSSSLRSRR
ncbi:GIY-YIG nuclease family protein [Nocardioides daphniae]|uniref:GIY-YIG nuclease family protein n=1 Tax=Nocardioides daphniae TaxID=402297 RepID=UPI003B8A6E94